MAVQPARPTQADPITRRSGPPPHPRVSRLTWFREQMDRDDDPEIPVRWYVFDPDGMLQHVVRLPYAWQSLSIGADYVLALDRDAFGVDTDVFAPLART